MADITRNESGRIDPTSSQLDPSQPWNQVRPRSLRTSGLELDESCESGSEPHDSLTFSEGVGKSLDEMIAKIDGKGNK